MTGQPATSRLTVHPGRLRHFGGAAGVSFTLVTAPDWASRIDFGERGEYADVHVVPWPDGTAFESLLEGRIPRPGHVLVVHPERYFQSPDAEKLGNDLKLSVMACRSTPSPMAAIQHFLEVGEASDPAGQDAIGDGFFAASEAADVLIFEDPNLGTHATLEHHADGLQWHEQIGALDWGGQQLFPPGEISVLPVALYDEGMTATLPLDGTIALHGPPVLHSGTPSFLPEDQARIYRVLTGLERAPVIADIERGQVTQLRPAQSGDTGPCQMLEALCEIDSRYRVVIEIGLSVNLGTRPFPGNAAMNEVIGGRAGTVHWGFGLIPNTQYHLDVLCPGTRVVDEAGRAVFAAEPDVPKTRRRIQRHRGAACPCQDEAALRRLPT